ncbi:MAG TPA: SRPBCC family protein [Chitinophagaceae bacterium]|nr:SRPBCC family protein [Chitinophagaceae bacterium]
MLQNKLAMGVHVLQTVQKIPADIEEVWDFFSRPDNLALITPPEMNFAITSPNLSNKIYAGEIITYKIKPIAGISLTWVTEITQVKDKAYFADEQRKGPYALWRHEHFFNQIEGGVEMTDRVYYKIPMGLLGDIANPLFVYPKLKSIFTYRFKKIETLWGSWNDGKPGIIEFY